MTVRLFAVLMLIAGAAAFSAFAALAAGGVITLSCAGWLRPAELVAVAWLVSLIPARS